MFPRCVSNYGRLSWFALMVWLGVGAAVSRSAGADLAFLDRLLDRDVDLVVDTDVSEEGRKLAHPTPEHPVYCEWIIIGYKDFGREPGDAPQPNRGDVLKALEKMLADRGYLHADRLHPPQLAVALAWGTMNARRSFALPFMGGQKLQLQRDLDPVVQLMTPYSLRRRFWTPLQEYLVEISGGDLYVVSVWAFDDAAIHRGEKKMLWQTKLTCPSTGLEIGYTLQRMSRAALPYLGQETELPVRVTAPRLKYDVEIGELQTLEFLDPKPAPKTPVPPKPGDGVKK